jgi:hypothetical protein
VRFCSTAGTRRKVADVHDQASRRPAEAHHLEAAVPHPPPHVNSLPLDRQRRLNPAWRRRRAGRPRRGSTWRRSGPARWTTASPRSTTSSIPAARCTICRAPCGHQSSPTTRPRRRRGASMPSTPSWRNPSSQPRRLTPQTSTSIDPANCCSTTGIGGSSFSRRRSSRAARGGLPHRHAMDTLTVRRVGA